MMNGINALILSLSMGITSTLMPGCVSVPLNPNYEGPKPLPQRFEDLTSPARPQNMSVALVRKEEGYSVYTLNIDGCKSSLYMPRIKRKKGEEKNKFPTVIITPGMGGGEILTNYIAEGFVDSGISAIILNQPDFLEPEDDGNDLERKLEESTRNARSVVNWIHSQNKYFDLDRTGSLGISMGAIRNMILAAVEPRIEANIFVMGGGNLPHIVLESGETAKYVIERKRREGLSDEGLIEDLSSVVLDPANLAQYIDARGVLMIISRFDTIVPTKRQIEIRELMGGPRTIYIPTGHVSGGMS